MMRTSVAFILFTLLLLAGAIAHLSIGARVIAPRTVVDAFFHFDPRNFEHSVIVRLRLMRLCAALMTGAALGVAGVLLQSVIRNPLGEPHILGLNAGAALAVVLTSALGRALFAGANVLLIRAYRSHADEGHAVRRGDVGICLIDNRHGVDSG